VLTGKSPSPATWARGEDGAVASVGPIVSRASDGAPRDPENPTPRTA